MNETFLKEKFQLGGMKCLLVLCCWSSQITDDGVGELLCGGVAAQVLGLHL